MPPDELGRKPALIEVIHRAAVELRDRLQAEKAQAQP
jgi:hypothetical protein